MKGLLVFDMDGVLVDVTDSYRETIRQTVHTLTGREITRELIQDYKNQGGWNNDWLLSQKICQDLGCAVSYESVVDVFQKLFLGANQDGLLLREQWIPSDGLLQRIGGEWGLAVFTGRPRAEAEFTLRRFVPEVRWSSIVADEDVQNAKPAPDGLLMLRRLHEGASVVYVGDTVDDARSARAANVRFIGIAHAANTRRVELITLLKAEGAETVLENVNEVESIL